MPNNRPEGLREAWKRSGLNLWAWLACDILFGVILLFVLAFFIDSFWQMMAVLTIFPIQMAIVALYSSGTTRRPIGRFVGITTAVLVLGACFALVGYLMGHCLGPLEKLLAPW